MVRSVRVGATSRMMYGTRVELTKSVICKSWVFGALGSTRTRPRPLSLSGAGGDGDDNNTYGLRTYAIHNHTCAMHYHSSTLYYYMYADILHSHHTTDNLHHYIPATRNDAPRSHALAIHTYIMHTLILCTIHNVHAIQCSPCNHTISLLAKAQHEITQNFPLFFLSFSLQRTKAT